MRADTQTYTYVEVKRHAFRKARLEPVEHGLSSKPLQNIRYRYCCDVTVSAETLFCVQHVKLTNCSANRCAIFRFCVQ